MRRSPLAAPLLTVLLAAPALAASPAFSPVLVQLPGEARAELLGAWTGSGWVDARKAAPRIPGGETYRAAPLYGSASAVKGGRATSFGDPCELAHEVRLTPATPQKTFRLLTPASPKLRPRPVVSLPTNNSTYREVVRAELLKRGLSNPQVNLLGVTRADLDGNGTEEVIVEAAHFAERSGLYPPPVGAPGDYSLLLLRQVVNGRVVTTVLGDHVAPRTPWDPGSDRPMPMATLYRLAGVADLNGDGRMELVTFGSYYEGYGLNVQEWTPKGWKSRLEGGCGV